jgi:hypothetical protein
MPGMDKLSSRAYNNVDWILISFLLSRYPFINLSVSNSTHFIAYNHIKNALKICTLFTNQVPIFLKGSMKDISTTETRTQLRNHSLSLEKTRFFFLIHYKHKVKAYCEFCADHSMLLIYPKRLR